jgi:hypothetical protein
MEDTSTIEMLLKGEDYKNNHWFGKSLVDKTMMYFLH